MGSLAALAETPSRIEKILEGNSNGCKKAY